MLDGLLNQRTLWIVAAGAASLVLSLALVMAVVVALPPTYFVSDVAHSMFAGRSRGVQVAAKIGKNALGLALLALGLVMALPGVPGQGLLTMLVGVTLLDLPGKRSFERKVVSRPAVRRSLDAIRLRFGKEPFVL